MQTEARVKAERKDAEAEIQVRGDGGFSQAGEMEKAEMWD